MDYIYKRGTHKGPNDLPWVHEPSPFATAKMLHDQFGKEPRGDESAVTVECLLCGKTSTMKQMDLDRPGFRVALKAWIDYHPCEARL